MGNNKIRHTLHRRSNVGNLVTVDIERDSLEVIKPKSPTPENIEYGEIAINFGKDYEGMFIKNSENEIIQLNTVEHLRYDGKIDESLEQYLDDRFVNRSGDTIYGSITIQADGKHPEYNDDPVFKYIGSEFDVSAKTSALSGETLSVIENEVTTDIEKAKTDITNHTYRGNTLDADIFSVDYSGETLDMHVVDASYSGKTLTVDILGGDEKCDANLTVNSNNITTHVDCLMNTEVDGNVTEVYHSDKSETVDGSLTELVKTDKSETVNGNVIENIDGTKSETVDGNVTEVYNSNKSETIIGTSTINIEDGLTTNVTKGNVVENVTGNTTTKITGNVYETIGGDVEETVKGNVIENINGTKSETVDGNVVELFNSNKTEIISGTSTINIEDGLTTNVTKGNVNTNITGNVTENIGGNVIENIDGTKSETVDGNVTEVYNSNKSEYVDDNSELSIKGNYTVSVSGYTNFTCTGTTTTTIGTHDYNITNLDADVKHANLSGDTLSVTERETNINSTESLNITGTTTNMEGNSLNVVYDDVNISGNTEVDIDTPKLDVYATNTTIDGTSMTINETNYTLSGANTTMKGTNLDMDYSNVDIESTTKVDITTPEYNITGDTTNMQGGDLNVNYTTIDTTASTSTTVVGVENKTATTVNNTVTTKNDHITNWNANGDKFDFDYNTINLSGKTTVLEGDVLNETYNTINRKATTINDSATTYNISSTTENHHSTTTNYYGDVNISEDLHVSGDSIFEGDVTINGNLNIPEGKTIDGYLDNPLNFRVIKSGVSTNVDAVDDYSYYNQGETGLTVANILASKDYVDEMYALLLDDSGMTETIDSFKELKEVLGKDSSDVDSTYGTVIEAINKRVFRSGDTMSGDLNIVNSSTINLSTAGTITTKSNIKSNGVFVGKLEKTISFADGMFSAKSFNNSADTTINIPSQSTLDGRYVNNSGDTISGNLKITSGGLNVTGDTSVSGTVSATSDITTNGSFVGNLDNTLTFESGAFSGKSFDNSSNVTVKIPTDLSHLSCTGAPSSWTAMDSRYVNLTGDTMTGALKISSGGLSVTGNTSVSGTISASSAIYSSDIVLKTDIESVSENDIKLVSGIDLKSYKFKDDETNRERYGVIAQDLEAANLNHLVVESESGIKGVDYISFLILKIAQLEKEIKELKSKK